MKMPKKAVIVAAGKSSRLYPLTLEKPKGLLPLAGSTLLQRSVNMLQSVGVSEVAIVVGYKQQIMKAELGTDYHYIENPFYAECNNMGSLWFASSFVADDPFIYLHSDIAYDELILKDAVEDFGSADASALHITDFGPTDEEAMKVRVDANNVLLESNKAIPEGESAGEWTGISLFREPRPLFQEIEECLYGGALMDYDTFAFSRLAEKNYKQLCYPTKDRPWLEIDFVEDYERAKELFGE